MHVPQFLTHSSQPFNFIVHRFGPTLFIDESNAITTAASGKPSPLSSSEEHTQLQRFWKYVRKEVTPPCKCVADAQLKAGAHEQAPLYSNMTVVPMLPAPTPAAVPESDRCVCRRVNANVDIVCSLCAV